MKDNIITEVIALGRALGRSLIWYVIILVGVALLSRL